MTMNSLDSIEIKAFIPARSFERSLQFYQDLGFTLKSSGHGIAYFCHGTCSFLLQDFYNAELAKNFMMHLLVTHIDAWWTYIHEQELAQRYNVPFSAIQQQPWGMREFTLTDPSGVLWRIAENV